ncbi:chemosensory protein precursor [Danaus plexippus plexippus]|uniref:Chemosensory protein n=1 Tax=Danaus plexippus plexippus TaxID=278856 RepID=A0A212FPU8_DANPL|nr:chemosensory protein precursor [Danaus plexippus plexippus]
MKFSVILALVALVAAPPEDNYDRYENFDVDELASNLQWIPDAVQSNCGKFSENQKHIIGRVNKAFIDKLPEEWKKLKAIHNPGGKYVEGPKNVLDKYE